jgi:5-deoxy-D-glucuronate isomerase
MNLLIKPKKNSQQIVSVTPQSAGWRYISFSAHQLASGNWITLSDDRDVVLVPRGYHPVVVPHGYQSYYFNVMAGPKRVWHFHNDPAHEWILKQAS